MPTSVSPSLTKRVDDLLEELHCLHSKTMQFSGSLNALKAQKSYADSKVQSLSYDEQVGLKTTATLLNLLKQVSEQYYETVQNLVTGGLKAVFDDLDLDFYIEIVKYRNYSAVKFNLKNKGVEFPLIGSIGGGVLAVISVLLRVSTIMMLEMQRVLVLDESLVHVSDQYIPNVSALLKRLAADLGFKILLVTHQKEFVGNADHHYRVKNMTGGITLEKVK